MKALFFTIITVLITSSAFGATYIPLPIESQIEKSYGVIEGTFQGSTYKKLPNGAVATIASFHVMKHVGVKKSDIKNNFDFKIIMPGGVWDDLTYYVTGVPNFKKDELVILLVSQGKFGLQLHNLGMGKYQVLSDNDGNKFLTSHVFPKHPTLGKIPYKKFNQVVKKSFGSALTPFTKDMYVYKNIIKSKRTTVDKRGQRSPASRKGRSANLPFSPIFLVLVLASFGAYGTYLMRDK
ncbi:MAG: hypothetical protein KAG61_14165 [Bacteriovoracaceae bacterium]|nr:hypothetical protein [Bacteriovoracaceae bacterium]